MAGVGIGSEGGVSWENTGAATRPFAWGTGPFADVRLVVELATECFPFEDWALHPPPTSQTFPARCDAFDRNLDVFLVEGDPPAATAGLIGSGPPSGRAFEVIHAITPFGGPARFEADLTDLANALPGSNGIRVELASFSDPAGRVTGSNAGWTVSATLTVTPGRAPRRVLAAEPLFAVRLGAGESPLGTVFEVPSGATGGRIEYRASGHGQGAQGIGCNGPAEEFCSRRHVVSVDSVEIASLEPRRTDCQSLCTLAHFGPPVVGGFDYCAENPCGEHP